MRLAQGMRQSVERGHNDTPFDMLSQFREADFQLVSAIARYGVPRFHWHVGNTGRRTARFDSVIKG